MGRQFWQRRRCCLSTRQLGGGQRSLDVLALQRESLAYIGGLGEAEPRPEGEGFPQRAGIGHGDSCSLCPIAGAASHCLPATRTYRPLLPSLPVPRDRGPPADLHRCHFRGVRAGAGRDGGGGPGPRALPRAGSKSPSAGSGVTHPHHWPKQGLPSSPLRGPVRAHTNQCAFIFKPLSS